MDPNIRYLNKKLADFWWRITNLYYITNSEGKKVLFKPNKVQMKLLAGLHDKTVVLKARQFGITTVMAIFLLDRVLWIPNIECGMVLQTLPLAQNVFQKKILYAYNNLPASIRRMKPHTKMDGGELRIKHASKIDENGKEIATDVSSVMVSTSLRSTTMQYLHISEFAKICAEAPNKADEIVSGSLNSGSRCIVTIESTAEGDYGHYYDFVNRAMETELSGEELTSMDYKFFFFPWWDHDEYVLNTPVDIPKKFKEYFLELENHSYCKKNGIDLTDQKKWWYVKKFAEQKEKMYQEFPSYPDEAFAQSGDSCFYKDEMNEVFMQKRVDKKYAWNPAYPVYTGWDIGVKDSTIIVFFQVYDGKVFIIDCSSGVRKGLPEYLKMLKEKPYEYAEHFLPHDVKVMEWGTGQTRQERALSEHGFVLRQADKLGLSDCRDKVRDILPMCHFTVPEIVPEIDRDFNTNDSKMLVSALRGYKKTWNPKMKRYDDTPLHDWCSDYEAAFRSFAVMFDQRAMTVRANTSNAIMQGGY